MGQALYRKYRSRSLDDVVGQEHITDTLKNALKTDKISHAYLFTGPRGVGKTSVARILAHEINGLPYGDDNHLDIIEIDAASNNGVEDIRDLREKVTVSPTSAKYKVYIIDEVHMLSKSAFNALLKTLEEPPAHAVFILATTEAHKLPETIVSRTQRYGFRPIEATKVIAHLKDIAAKEKIDIDDDALALIARHGEGSFRDSIGLLDQASALSRRISRDLILNLLGLAPEEQVEAIIAALTDKDSASLIKQIAAAEASGQNPSQLASQLEASIKQKLVAGDIAGQPWFDLAKQLLGVPASTNPGRYLEIILLEFTLNHAATTSAPKPAATRHQPPISAPQEAVNKTKAAPTRQPRPEKAKPASPAAVAPDTDDIWKKVLDVLKKDHNTLYAVARMARADVAPAGITLYFKFAFHQKRINDAKNQKIIVDIIKKLTGKDVAISCELEVKQAVEPSKVADKNVETAEPASGNDDLSAISNIFGGGELID